VPGKLLMSSLFYLGWVIFSKSDSHPDFLFVLVMLEFELRASCTLPPEPLCQPFFVLGVSEIVSCELFPGAGLEP
jgi:hypothetical protein